jgi:hypothetical protein
MEVAPLVDDKVGISPQEGDVELTKPSKSYFGPVHPEGPKFQNPQDDLLAIGVSRVSTLRRTQLQRESGTWIGESREERTVKKKARRVQLP